MIPAGTGRLIAAPRATDLEPDDPFALQLRQGWLEQGHHVGRAWQELPPPHSFPLRFLGKEGSRHRPERDDKRVAQGFQTLSVRGVAHSERDGREPQCERL